jgi:hypothetical protein
MVLNTSEAQSALEGSRFCSPQKQFDLEEGTAFYRTRRLRDLVDSACIEASSLNLQLACQRKTKQTSMRSPWTRLATAH